MGRALTHCSAHFTSIAVYFSYAQDFYRISLTLLCLCRNFIGMNKYPAILALLPMASSTLSLQLMLRLART